MAGSMILRGASWVLVSCHAVELALDVRLTLLTSFDLTSLDLACLVAASRPPACLAPVSPVHESRAAASPPHG